MSESRSYELIVNAVRHVIEADEGAPLVYILRNHIGAMGVRFGCGEGLCGACAVLIDGKDVQSCQVTVDEAAGHEITTVEGLLEADGSPGRVQRAIIDRCAGQCGFCLSGIVIRIEAALADADVTYEDLVRKLTGNLCRCGAHVRILRAVAGLVAK